MKSFPSYERADAARRSGVFLKRIEQNQENQGYENERAAHDGKISKAAFFSFLRLTVLVIVLIFSRSWVA